MLNSFGMDITNNDIDSLMSRFDVDGDNMIDLDEFKGFMSNGLQSIGIDKNKTSSISNNNYSVDVSSMKSSSKNGSNGNKHHQTYPLPSNGARPGLVNPLLMKIEEHDESNDFHKIHEDDNDEDDIEEEIDSLWLARMLKAQAEIEARVGKRYFN